MLGEPIKLITVVFDIPNWSLSTSLKSRIDPWMIDGLYTLIEGSLGLTQFGNDSFGIFGKSGIENSGNLGRLGALGREFEHPVNTRQISRIKVNLFIIS